MMKASFSLCIAAVLSVMILTASAFGAPAQVKISGVKGDVQVMKAGSSSWEKGLNGFAITQGAKVKAGPNSSCLLNFSGGHTVKVNALTSITVDKSDVTGPSKNTQLSIDSGKMYAKVGKVIDKNSSFTIKTPTAVAGVRGSEIFVTVDQNSSSFQVVDGSFSVAAEGVEVVLDQNIQVDVTAGAPPPEPEAIPPAELQQVQTETEEIKTEIQESGINMEETSQAPTEGTQEATAESSDATSTDATDSIDNATQQQELDSIIQDQLNNLAPGTGAVEMIIE